MVLKKIVEVYLKRALKLDTDIKTNKRNLPKVMIWSTLEVKVNNGHGY